MSVLFRSVFPQKTEFLNICNDFNTWKQAAVDRSRLAEVFSLREVFGSDPTRASQPQKCSDGSNGETL